MNEVSERVAPNLSRKDRRLRVYHNAFSFSFLLPARLVIAIDTSMERLKIARHNAMQYGVADRIEFICADYVEFVASWARRKQRQREERGEMEVVVGLGEEVDVIFLSPPWGESKGFLHVVRCE